MLQSLLFYKFIIYTKNSLIHFFFSKRGEAVERSVTVKLYIFLESVFVIFVAYFVAFIKDRFFFVIYSV